MIYNGKYLVTAVMLVLMAVLVLIMIAVLIRGSSHGARYEAESYYKGGKWVVQEEELEDEKALTGVWLERGPVNWT
jgi:hypothetical protein